MAFEAATVAVFSILHLSGVLHVGSGRSYGAGFAEAIIAIVLAGGAAALARSPGRGRQPAIYAVGFAIFGFIVGLSFTVSGGDAIDLAYHAAMLPLLGLTGVLLARGPRAPAAPRGVERAPAPRRHV